MGTNPEEKSSAAIIQTRIHKNLDSNEKGGVKTVVVMRVTIA
jgi:hypothetical protein